MSALRRSARIASKNASKNTSKPSQNTCGFVIVDEADDRPILAEKTVSEACSSSISVQQLFSSQSSHVPLSDSTPDHFVEKTQPRLCNTRYDHKPLSVSNGWHLEYDLFRDEMPTMSPEILSETLEFHKRNHSGDEWHAKQTCPERWKQELYPASRWFCVDSRLFLESEEMREKSKIHAYTVNRNLPSLYAHIAYLEVQVRRTTGRQLDVIRHELLMTKLLRELADHAHSTWNEWNIEFNELNKEPFKPEMPIDSDDEY